MSAWRISVPLSGVTVRIRGSLSRTVSTNIPRHSVNSTAPVQKNNACSTVSTTPQPKRQRRQCCGTFSRWYLCLYLIRSTANELSEDGCGFFEAGKEAVSWFTKTTFIPGFLQDAPDWVEINFFLDRGVGEFQNIKPQKTVYVGNGLLAVTDLARLRQTWISDTDQYRPTDQYRHTYIPTDRLQTTYRHFTPMDCKSITCSTVSFHWQFTPFTVLTQILSSFKQPLAVSAKDLRKNLISQDTQYSRHYALVAPLYSGERPFGGSPRPMHYEKFWQLQAATGAPWHHYSSTVVLNQLFTQVYCQQFPCSIVTQFWIVAFCTSDERSDATHELTCLPQTATDSQDFPDDGKGLREMSQGGLKWEGGSRGENPMCFTPLQKVNEQSEIHGCNPVPLITPTLVSVHKLQQHMNKIHNPTLEMWSQIRFELNHGRDCSEDHQLVMLEPEEHIVPSTGVQQYLAIWVVQCMMGRWADDIVRGMAVCTNSMDRKERVYLWGTGNDGGACIGEWWRVDQSWGACASEMAEESGRSLAHNSTICGRLSTGALSSQGCKPVVMTK
ncbi:hypothetical protein DFH08DRAFT_818594 [Mycena albidolilacea]|uniref:Uncharacterized protein n=1 Tax=Mycena albidolilacea TaxID=1033008 RepID=A0AAD6ZFK6_9AGAR|nr:hypothetical protein DFH08DRAFT_818594 [Mycena albidolilacea]